MDPNIAQWFQAVDTDKSGHITASELQRALVNGNWSHFSEEACRMMIGETKTRRFRIFFKDIFSYILTKKESQYVHIEWRENFVPFC